MAKQNPGRVLASAAQGSKSDVDAKLKGVVVEEVAAVEAESAAAAAAPVVDAAMLASAESIFAADASPVLVAQAGGASGGMLAGGVSTGTLLAVGAGVLAIGGAVALASSGDDDNDDDNNGGNQPVNPTITVTASATSITEGGTGVTYTITTTGFNNGDEISYNISGANITTGDVDQPLSGRIKLDANGRAIFTVSAVSDGVTEGAETFTFATSTGGAPGVPSATGNAVTTTINDQQTNQVFTLTQGVDSGAAFVGTAGNDTFDGRNNSFDQFDSIDGGAGTDTLIVDGSIDDVDFGGAKSIEIVATENFIALGANAAAAGVQQLQLKATNNVAVLNGFNAALTVTAGAGNDFIALSLADAGNKTLNLGAGIDFVDVADASATAGGTQVNFTSGSVGNGTDSPVTIVGANGNVTVNDEGTVLTSTNGVNSFNVVGLDANGAVDAAQNRGNFQTVVLGAQGSDNLDTGSFSGNVYINGGSGDDVLSATAFGGQRHFLVGGAGNDTLNLETFGGTVVAIAGAGDDAVSVTGTGIANVSLTSGTNTVTFADGLVLNTAVAANNDVLTGGTGRDTLAATSDQLTAVNNSVTDAVQSISAFEALTVTDELDSALNTTRVQAGIDTVTLAAGTSGGNTVTFGSGVAGTLNLGSEANGSISLASAGTGTSDSLTIANTAAADATTGRAIDAFDGQAISTTGVETLTVNTSAAGTATRQDIDGITGTTLATVNFVGGNSVDAGSVNVKTVSASGLTGTAGLTVVAGFTGASNNRGTITGSANSDSVTYTGTQFITVDTGAGNDTVRIEALDGSDIKGRLIGGEGTDTLDMDAAVAAAATVANTPVSTKIEGFEVLKLGQANGETVELRFLGTTQKVISAGTLAGGLTVRDLANGGTFELTGAIAGATSIVVRDADLRTTDSVNLVLNGAAQLNNAVAELTVSNVETININSTYSGSTAPAVVSTLDLAANVATSIVVTGNNGLDLTGSTLGAVTSFDASGVTAGGVTFLGQNTAATTIKGGAGDDVLGGNTGNDTITLGAGSDTVVFAATKATNGVDAVSGFSAGALDKGGDILDLNGIGANVTAVDGNGSAAGLSFNATASNTVDLLISGTNSQVHVVIDGSAELNLGNVKAQTSNTAQFGEILVADGASQYVLHASADGSSTAQLYRVFDSNAGAGAITAAVELIGTISLTNTVGDLVAANFG